MKAMKAIVAMLAAVGFCLVAGTAMADTTWVDEIGNSVSFYKANYPTSNWEPYEKKLATVREALSRGDQQTIRLEMNQFFRMLQRRAHGINDVAADELFNFSVMVTPVQEYGISVPATVTSIP